MSSNEISSNRGFVSEICSLVDANLFIKDDVYAHPRYWSVFLIASLQC